MITSVKTALAVLVGVGIGAVSMNALRAQANPLAYFIAEITEALLNAPMHSVCLGHLILM